MGLLIRDVVEQGMCLSCGLCVSSVENLRLTQSWSVPVLPADLDQEVAEELPCPGSVTYVSGRPEPSHTFVGWAADPDIRFRGASGGALSALARFLLQAQLVDEVIAVDQPDGDVAGARARSFTLPTISSSVGSRYAESQVLGEAVRRVRANPSIRLAFIGKPCDVASLRRLQRVDPDVREAIPVALTFFCAGLPSAEARRRLVDLLRANLPSTLRPVALRFRGHGWPGNASLVAEDGTTATMSYEESWGSILGRSVHPRCKLCGDGMGADADVSFGDAWNEGPTGRPDFSDAPGKSLIVTNTPLGEELIARAVEAHALEILPAATYPLERLQAHQADRSAHVQARVLGWRLAGARLPRIRRTQAATAPWPSPPLRSRLRQLAGSARRRRRWNRDHRARQSSGRPS